MLQSRITVTAETFSTPAISSTLNPPKYRSSTTRLFRASTDSSSRSASSSATSSAAGSGGDNRRFLKRHMQGAGTLLQAVASASVVDQYVAHDSRREAEEVRPVLPARLRLIGEPKVS